MAYRANLFDFGAVAGEASGANAVANDAAFVAAMASPTKLIEIEPEVFEFSTTIQHNVHGKKFVGIDGAECFGSLSYGTRLKWTGEAGGEMVRIAPPIGEGDLIAPGFSDIELDGNCLAGRGLTILSSRCPAADNLHILRMQTLSSTIGVYMGSRGVGQGGINCVYRPSMSRLRINVSGGAHGIMFDGVAGEGNSTFGSIYDPHITHENGVAIYFRAADDMHLFNAGTSRLENGTGVSALFDGTGPAWVVGNTIHGLHCGAHPAGSQTTILSRGSKARQNTILPLAGVDNQPAVLITTGSELTYYYMGGGYTSTTTGEKALFRMPKRDELTYA